ncbi:MAG: AMP-binding protein [Gemmatimonadota bacterium]
MTTTIAAGTGSLSGALTHRAISTPDAPFLVTDDRTWSFSEAATDSHALAAGLVALGMEPGDRVALDMPNWPEFVLSVFAAAEIGAVIVPLNPGYSQRELRFVLRNTEATVAIVAERYGGIDYLEVFEALFSELPSLQYLVTVGEEDLWYDDRVFQFEDVLSSGRAGEVDRAEVDPQTDEFAVLYTAGTSEKQKGVMLSHENLLRTATATAEVLGMTSSDVTLCTVPLFNIFGLGAALLTCLQTGSRVVLQDRFDPEGALRLIAEHEVTVLHGVPTMFVLLQRELRMAGEAKPDLTSLRTGIIAGAPVTPELVRSLRAELVPDLEIAYGLTETSPTVTITTPTDAEGPRTESVGKPLAGIRLRILDEEERTVPPGVPGEVAVAGYNVMRGYFRQPGATRAALADGYLKTGDLGLLDDEGYLRIVGRQSDMIIRGGFNVHPGEVEDHLRSLPAVEEAVVIGVPNEVLGELVCACIVPVEGALITEDELRELCRSALAVFKVPDLVAFMDELPKLPSGEVDRTALLSLVRSDGSERPGTQGDAGASPQITH